MSRVLVAGCGFAGLATARLLHARGWEVLGATHSPESAAALSGEPFPVIACDITNRKALAALPWMDAVIHCASSSHGGADQYRAVYGDGARNLAEVLGAPQFIFTSSTSVYAQTDGSPVTEDSPAEPGRETGQILRAAEECVLAGGGTVARLAGIYGPGRSVLLRKFFSGEAVLEAGGQRYLNQIHRDDIARALVHLLESKLDGLFNVSDDQPLTQRAVYEWLAARFQRPLPPDGPADLSRKRGWTSKQVSNAKLRALGWQPRFPSFFHAVEHDPGLVAALQP